ncbi:MAG TPA: hypothetical protein VFY79_00395 [Dehalococcoidia bacterium]|nr:hypothetical protein [Dehalococcoidia bacterium]
MSEQDLRAAVEQQAHAHVTGDEAAFASWMEPGAVVELGRTAEQARGIRPRRFNIITVAANDAGGSSAVRYDGGGSYVIEQRWELSGGGWKAVRAERPPESIRQPRWRRLFARRQPAPERRDLS